MNKLINKLINKCKHSVNKSSFSRTINNTVVELPGDVERVVRDEGEGRMWVGVVAQLLQLEHVHRPVQRHFGP